MIRINLLPVKAAQKKEMLRGQLIIVLVSVVFVLIGCAGVYASLQSKISAEKEKVADVRTEIGHLRKSIGDVAHFKKLQADLKGKLNVLNHLKAKKSGPVHILDELSRAIPEKVWLTSFTDSRGSVKISGLGFNQDVVAGFMQNLAASPYFGNVELQVIEQNSHGSLKLQKFQISCKAQTPRKKTSK